MANVPSTPMPSPLGGSPRQHQHMATAVATGASCNADHSGCLAVLASGALELLSCAACLGRGQGGRCAGEAAPCLSAKQLGFSVAALKNPKLLYY
jgi:hypothetical protein